MEPLNSERPNVAQLIIVPSIITLAITLVRLVGELQHWSTALFSPAPGGGGALVGISWLVPVFGIYFGAKLAKAGGRPANIWKAMGLAVLGFILIVIGGAVGFGGTTKSLSRFALGLLIMAVGGAIQYYGWPALFKVLIAYAYAARIPVTIVMFFAIRGNWGTHYDVNAPGLPDMPALEKFVTIGLLPQLIFWIAFTIVVGLLFGAPTAAILSRNRVRSLGDSGALTEP